MVVAAGQGHELGEQDQVLRLGWEKGQPKENGEADPLSDMTQNISCRRLRVVIRLRDPVIILELL